MVMVSSLPPLERYYNKVYAVVFSGDYKHVAAADQHGRIVLFELNYDDDLNTSAVKRIVHPSCAGGHVNALATYDDMLFCGTSTGSLHAYRWKELTSPTASRKVSTQLDVQVVEGGVCAVACVPDDEDTVLVGGRGDYNVRRVNVETGQVVSSLAGHTQAVRALCVGEHQPGVAYSASDDGTVRIWDVRANASVRTMEPSKTSASRPKHGAWLGCIAVNDNWLVTGGGPALSVWNMASWTHAVTLPADDVTPYYAVHMGKHSIIASGGRACLSHFEYSGRALGVTKTEVDTPICIASTDVDNADVLLAVTGYGNTVDIMDTPMSLAASLSMP